MTVYTEEQQELIEEAGVVCQVSGYYPAYFFLLDHGFTGEEAKLLLAEPEKKRQLDANEIFDVSTLIRKK